MANSWARRRQVYYGLGVAVFIIMIFAPIAYNIIHEEPTCFDGKQNQGETSIDKGGPCKLLDERAVQPLSVMWVRPFKVRDGMYSAVAYIENANKSSGIESITYQLKLYSENSLLIAERFGKVAILPGMVTPILETNINVGNRKVVRAVFQFVNREVWVDMQNPTLGIKVSEERVIDKDTRPTVSANVTNTGVVDKSDVVFIATVFDTAGNAFATSRTYIEKLGAGQTQQVVFTWPEAFTLPVARIDIIPLMAP